MFYWLYDIKLLLVSMCMAEEQGAELTCPGDDTEWCSEPVSKVLFT